MAETTTAALDLTVNQGTDWALRFRWEIDDTPVVLTDALMQARATRGASETLIDLALDAGITQDTETGTVTVTLDASATSDLPPGLWRYDALLTTASGAKRKLEGAFVVSASVSREGSS